MEASKGRNCNKMNWTRFELNGTIMAKIKKSLLWSVHLSITASSSFLSVHLLIYIPRDFSFMFLLISFGWASIRVITAQCASHVDSQFIFYTSHFTSHSVSSFAHFTRLSPLFFPLIQFRFLSRPLHASHKKITTDCNPSVDCVRLDLISNPPPPCRPRGHTSSAGHEQYIYFIT